MMPVRYAVRALRKFGLLDKLDIDVPMRLSGHNYRVPMIKGMGFVYVIDFEPFMDELIRTLVPRFPGVFVDCGVNLGQTLIKAKAAFPDIDYVGFEPNPACVAYTRRVIALNAFERVRLIDAGLTDTDGDGELVLWTGTASDPSATLLHDFRDKRPDQREIPVKLMTWGTVEKHTPIGRLGFVKIDVEGSELAVLGQLEPRLRTDRPITMVEVLPTHDPPIASRIAARKAMEAIIQRCDLRIHRIHRSGERMSLQAVPAFGLYTDQRLSDHLLIPAEREAEVAALFPVHQA
jgi:FkbM family methyltransferase